MLGLVYDTPAWLRTQLVFTTVRPFNDRDLNVEFWIKPHTQPGRIHKERKNAKEPPRPKNKDIFETSFSTERMHVTLRNGLWGGVPGNMDGIFSISLWFVAEGERNGTPPYYLGSLGTTAMSTTLMAATSLSWTQLLLTTLISVFRWPLFLVCPGFPPLAVIYGTIVLPPLPCTHTTRT